MGAAVKKKSLQTPGMNNVIGFISFTFAGSAFGLMHWLKTGTVSPAHLSPQFWHGMMGYAGLNIVGAWFLYRALDMAEFSHVMPFMALTSLAVIVPPMFVFGEMPTLLSVGGIALVAAGALVMNWHNELAHAGTPIAELKQRNRQGVLYFLATAACFTFTPTAAKVAIRESSVLFASFLGHLLVGAGFLGMVILCRESARLMRLFRARASRALLLGILAAGTLIVVENGCINAALAEAPVASVMAIKRMMPLFAFVIGLVYFRERTELRKKLVSTSLMITGAILVTLAK